MSGRRSQPAWWQEIARSERFNGAEWLLLGVSALAFAGALMMLVRVAI
jgi:hypothetical protein